MYYNCVKFHTNPISRLGGVALTRYMDGRANKVIPIYPQALLAGSILSYRGKNMNITERQLQICHDKIEK